jgi:hypothetical protein
MYPKCTLNAIFMYPKCTLIFFGVRNLMIYICRYVKFLKFNSILTS